MLKCTVEVTTWQKGEVEVVDEAEKEMLKLWMKLKKERKK